MRRVYPDHSVTIPIRPGVDGDNLDNPSSTHYFELLVRKAVMEAREKIARSIGADASEVVFTSVLESIVEKLRSALPVEEEKI